MISMSKALIYFPGQPANLDVSYILFDYDDFRDATQSQNNPLINPGEEDFFDFGATIIQLYLSFWF